MARRARPRLLRAQLPNVPVLRSLVETIDSAQKDISALATNELTAMAKVEVLNVDQSLPPDEGELYSKEPVPLPFPPQLMRQFTPPADGPLLRGDTGGESGELSLELPPVR